MFENSDEGFIYTIIAGDILTKYEVSDFPATINYPADKWVEWSWTYRYLKEGKRKALDLHVEIADIALKNLSKLDTYIQRSNSKFYLCFCMSLCGILNKAKFYFCLTLYALSK